jgi:hypothetical protein
MKENPYRSPEAHGSARAHTRARPPAWMWVYGILTVAPAVWIVGGTIRALLSAASPIEPVRLALVVAVLSLSVVALLVVEYRVFVRGSRRLSLGVAALSFAVLVAILACVGMETLGWMPPWYALNQAPVGLAAWYLAIVAFGHLRWWGALRKCAR